MSDPRHLLGHRAEDAVGEWLARCGWRVLARRWRCAAGELDLVCSDRNGVLVGVEVRARRTRRAGSAAESVSRGHLLRMRAALATYATTAATAHRGLRLELVTVDPAANAPTGREPQAWRLARFPIDGW
jgi:putative endonuclease